MANFFLAFAQGLQLIPVLNKIDLPSSDPERALDQMKTHFEIDPESAVSVSAKTGHNVDCILPAVIEQTTPYVPHYGAASRRLMGKFQTYWFERKTTKDAAGRLMV